MIVKRIVLTALVLVGVWLLQNPRLLAQGASSQQDAIAADNGAGAFLDQEWHRC
jgi:preprotein translocase subunit SecG